MRTFAAILALCACSLASPAARGEDIPSLEPFLGEWEAPFDGSTVKVSYKRILNGKYIAYDMVAVAPDGKETLSHHAILGEDPEAHQLKATGFRSDGYQWTAYWEKKPEGGPIGTFIGRFSAKDSQADYSGVSTKVFIDKDSYTEEILMTRDGQAVDGIPKLTFKRKK